jgi:amidase
MVDRGLVPAEFAEHEIWDLSIWSWDDFLGANDDPNLHRLADVDGSLIFPHPTGALRDRYDQDDDIDLAEYVERAKAGVRPLAEIPTIADGLRGLEETRRLDLEQWMDEVGLDAVVFPAAADVGPADADVNPESAALAWRNGTWVANGNLVPRHLGIPTVTVPMGTMADTGMPVGLTFVGKGYDDSNLLRYAWAFEQSSRRRTVPPRTPALADEVDGVFAGSRVAPAGALDPPVLHVSESRAGDVVVLRIRVEFDAGADIVDLALFVNGSRVEALLAGSMFTATADVPAREHEVLHSEWREPYGSMVVAVVRSADGRINGAFAVSSGPV